MPKVLLLADDSVVIQKLVGLSFANEDIEVITTDNGDDALTRAREVDPDVVLADVMMPGKNGYEVCEALKADVRLGHVPVLLLTGTFEAFDEDRAREVGSDGHITKPFETQALVERVTGLLASTPAAAPVPPSISQSDHASDSGAGVYEFFDDDSHAETVVSALEESPASPFTSANPDDVFDFGLERYPISATAPLDGDPDALDPNFDLGADALADLTVASQPEFGTDPGRSTAGLDPIDLGDRTLETDFLAPPRAEVDALDVSFAEPLPSLDDESTSLHGGYDLSISDLDDPLATSTNEVTPPAATAPGMDREAMTGGTGPDVSQVMRDRIHETLEKIAWEAFADVSDSIVRQVIERVESTVWEVVPQMTEALVREEIRRIKGDD